MPSTTRPAKNTKPAAAATPAKAVKKESKTAAPKVAAPKAAEPVKVDETPAENVVAVNAVDQMSGYVAALEQDFANAMAAMARISTEMTKLKTDLRAYHALAVRQVKTAIKAKGRRTKAKTGDRPASGFVKPTLISNELAAFLGVKAGTEMARTEVTKALHAYIQNHHLKNKDNGRIIEADGALSKLLNLQKGEELTYFNLQKYMTPHFAKHTATA